MGTRLAWIATLAAAASGCTGEYRGDPTPCDDYCLALQRAECAEDWPHQCVTQCEFTRSPDRYPECRSQFEALLACLQDAEDGDFACRYERSEPRGDICGFETKNLDFCTEPVFYRCLELCETRGALCANVDLNACFRSCRNPPAHCEAIAVSWLECELGEERACEPSPRCVPLQAELLSCVDS